MSDKFSHSETVGLKQVNVILRDNLFFSNLGPESLTYYEVVRQIYAINEFAYLNRFFSLNIMLDT